MATEEDKRNIFKFVTQDGKVIEFEQNPPPTKIPGTFIYKDPSTGKEIVIEVAGGANKLKEV